MKREDVLQKITEYSSLYPFSQIIPASARTGENVEVILEELQKVLPEGPKYFPEDMITDQPERLLVAEIVREKLFRCMQEEIPHAIAVEIEEIKTRPNEDLYVRAVIYVERESQKGIVIGAKGGLLKEIGRLAREDVQGLLGSKVYLDLWVKVKKDWRNRDMMLRTLGYKGE